MKAFFKAVSAAALVGTMAPAFLFAANRMTLDQVHTAMFVSTVVWFISAALWMED